MSTKFDLRDILDETRARVYLLWACLTATGFTATHYYQNKNINALWFLLAVAGLFYMYRVMPLRVTQMKDIYLSWLVPITLGIIITAITVHTDFLLDLFPYLGPFWLAIMALGYFWNGVFDPPRVWYFLAAAVNIAAAAVCYFSDPFTAVQYLVAGIVSAWSLLMLTIFRSDA